MQVPSVSISQSYQPSPEVVALLQVIETLQTQNSGLNAIQQQTIKDLKSRVEKLTKNHKSLEMQLLLEKQRNTELQKQEQERVKAEKARQEIARHAALQQRQQFEAEKARKREELLNIQNDHYRDYSLAKRVFDGMTSSLRYYRSSSTVKCYPDNHFMQAIYKGTEFYGGQTQYVYEIWGPTSTPGHFQTVLKHFQNVMIHHKALHEQAERQRDAIV